MLEKFRVKNLVRIIDKAKFRFQTYFFREIELILYRLLAVEPLASRCSVLEGVEKEKQ